MAVKTKSSVPKVKICGITEEREAEYLNEFQADYAGFVFYDKSKRNISFADSLKIMEKLDNRIKKVAVTVSPDERMIGILNEMPFDIIQIHGELSEDTLEKTAKSVWRAVNIKEDTGGYNDPAGSVFRLADSISAKIRGVLVDSQTFGSGKSFDWEKLKENLGLDRRWQGMEFILAGGLDKDNVARGIELFMPDVVDVSSKVEGERGKDRTKIKEFIEAVRSIKF